MKKATWCALLAALLTMLVIPGFLAGITTSSSRQRVRAEPDLGPLAWIPPGGTRTEAVESAELSPAAVVSGQAPSILLDRLGAFLEDSRLADMPDFPVADLSAADSEDLMRALSEVTLLRPINHLDEISWTMDSLRHLASGRLVANSVSARAAAGQPMRQVAGSLGELPKFSDSSLGRGAAAGGQAPVPEPSAGLLLACGAAVLVGLLHERRRVGVRS